MKAVLAVFTAERASPPGFNASALNMAPVTSFSLSKGYSQSRKAGSLDALRSRDKFEFFGKMSTMSSIIYFTYNTVVCFLFVDFCKQTPQQSNQYTVYRCVEIVKHK